MSAFVANADTASVLGTAETVTAVRGPDGRLLGLFCPGSGQEARLYLHAWLTLDPDEVRRQKSRPEPTFSYAEVKARIGMGDEP
ncbi:MAG TPA: hypothetical protein VGF55_26960 [Gemmataceae bacterium]|jgi:hypothetical protein